MFKNNATINKSKFFSFSYGKSDLFRKENSFLLKELLKSFVF